MDGIGIAVIAVVFAVAAAAAVACAVFYCNYTMLKRRNRLLDNLLEKSNDYRIDWNSDFTDVKYSENTLKSLQMCGTDPDADYLRGVFSTPGHIGPVDDISLAVNALREEGVTTSLNYSDNVSRNVMDKFKEKYREQHNFFRVLGRNSDISEFVLVPGIDETTVRMSEEMNGVFGFAADDKVTLEEFFALVKSEQLLAFQRGMNRLLSGISDSFSSQMEIKTAKNLFHSYLIRCKRTADAGDKEIIGAIIDVTGVEKHRRSGDSQYYDEQTGLLNRNGFMKYGAEFLEKSRDESKPCVAVCLQIVRLQKVIALFGIDMADTLTRLFAETLQQLMPEGSVRGKVGVEDFAVIFNSDDAAHVDRLLKQIAIVMENNCNNEILPSVLKEQSRFIAGACFYDGIDDITALYNKASVTLFSGSRISGNICCYFDASIEKKVCERDIVGQEIGDALKQGELELYYQPKICFKTGEVAGVEALMRWNHRTQGLIMPGDFIPVAEEIGLITKIDEWGLMQACIQAKLWQDKGYPPMKISVNMSQAQLYQTDVVETVREVLKESGLEARWLEVELTETMAMLDIERTVSVLTQLRRLGVSISMDDFGTGYSSLSSLKILPITQLKIDRSLVYDIETNETARHITKAIVDLGKAMRLDVLAEGVETEGQRILLESLGCDVAQGYLYSRPEPSAVIEKRFLVPAMQRA